MSIVTGAQIRMARAALSWRVRELAEKAGVMPNTISRIEGGSAARTDTLARVASVLENAGIVFIPENGGGPGVRFRDVMVRLAGNASLDRTRNIFEFDVLMGVSQQGIKCTMSLDTLAALGRSHGVDAAANELKVFAELVGPLGQVAARKIREGEIGPDRAVRIVMSDVE